MEMKIKSEKTPEQKEAENCMNEISKCRDRLQEIGYLREDNKGRSSKKIFSDFIEGYVCEMLNLERAKTNEEGFDGEHKGTGKKFQIKDTTNSEPVVGDKVNFDYLVAVELDKKDFSVGKVLIFPRKLIDETPLGNKKDFRYKNLKQSWDDYIYFDKSNGGWLKGEIE